MPCLWWVKASPDKINLGSCAGMARGGVGDGKRWEKMPRNMAIEVETGCLALKGDSIGALVTLPSLPTSATDIIYIYIYTVYMCIYGPYVASRFWILLISLILDSQ